MLKEIARAAGIDEKTLTDPEQLGILLIQSGNISTDTLMANEGKPDHYRYYDIQKMTDLEPGDTFQMQLYSMTQGSFPDGCGLSYERRDRPLAFGGGAVPLRNRQQQHPGKNRGAYGGPGL